MDERQKLQARASIISLSEGTYSVPSVAAVAIAAHEAGHAIQLYLGLAGGRWLLGKPLPR